MSQVYSDITGYMLEAANQVLLAPILPWVNSKHPKPRISFRKGNGNKTCIRFKHTRNSHNITYSFGIHMPQDKHDIFQAGRWLSTREILDRGYFNSEVSYLNLMAHTVLHEHSHVVQSLSDNLKKEDGVHNDAFYKILDKIHKSEYRDQVIHFLRQKFKANNIQEAFNNGAQYIPKEQIEFWQKLSKGEDVLNNIMYKDGDLLRKGEILKVSSSTAKVILDDSITYKIPKYMLFLSDVAKEMSRKPAYTGY